MDGFFFFRSGASSTHASIIVHVDFDSITKFHYEFVTGIKSAIESLRTTEIYSNHFTRHFPSIFISSAIFFVSFHFLFISSVNDCNCNHIQKIRLTFQCVIQWFRVVSGSFLQEFFSYSMFRTLKMNEKRCWTFVERNELNLHFIVAHTMTVSILAQCDKYLPSVCAFMLYTIWYENDVKLLAIVSITDEFYGSKYRNEFEEKIDVMSAKIVRFVQFTDRIKQ